MFYIGYFSFDSVDKEGQDHRGNFTCLVNADAPEKAADKFKEHLKETRKTGEVFSEKKISIYLDEIIEGR